MSLIELVLAWLAGLLVAAQWPLPVGFVLVGSGLCLAFGWLWRGTPLRRPLLLAGALLLGSTRLLVAEPTTTAASVWRYAGQAVTLVGTVTDQPDRREDRQTVHVVVTTLSLRNRIQAVNGVVELQLPPRPELRYGQYLRVQGTLLTPPSGPGFDRRAYLQQHGILVTMQQPKLTVLPGSGGSLLLRPLLAFNDRARLTALRLLPEPAASLLIGMLLGIQATIPAGVLRAFAATGTSHILVISGWNITIVVASVLRLFLQLGLSRRGAAAAALSTLALYVLFVGGSPSVLRAAAMGSLVVWADLAGRPVAPWTLLLTACGLLTLADPYALWDLGFQLSALATGGLFAFAGPITAWCERGPMRRPMLQWIIEPLAATIAASVLTLPLLLYGFGQLSLVAPLANVLLLPVVPLAMAFGTLAVIAGLIALPLGQLVALLCWPFLDWLLLGTATLARLPGAATIVPRFGIGWVWGYYGLVGLLVVWQAQRSRPRRPMTISLTAEFP